MDLLGEHAVGGDDAHRCRVGGGAQAAHDLVVGRVCPRTLGVRDLDDAGHDRRARRLLEDDHDVLALGGGPALEPVDEVDHRGVAVAPPAVGPAADDVHGVDDPAHGLEAIRRSPGVCRIPRAGREVFDTPPPRRPRPGGQAAKQTHTLIARPRDRQEPAVRSARPPYRLGSSRLRPRYGRKLGDPYAVACSRTPASRHGFEPTHVGSGGDGRWAATSGLRGARTCFTVSPVMLSQAHTTMMLRHGALSAGFVSCRPVDEPAQRTNDAAIAA